MEQGNHDARGGMEGDGGVRNMSFFYTVPQIRSQTKTVTRRLGWRFLRQGDLVCAVRKTRGLRKGEHVERLGILRVLMVSRERVDALERIGRAYDVTLEGFPSLSVSAFIEMFCRLNSCDPQTEITRIEFCYVAEGIEGRDASGAKD